MFVGSGRLDSNVIALRTHSVRDLVRRRPQVLWLLIAVWIAYSISGLRLPWASIDVGDGHSGGGLRKLLFGAAGALALVALLESRCLNAVLGLQRRLIVLSLGVLGTAVYSHQPVLTTKRGVILVFAVLAVAVAVHSTRDPVRRLHLVLVGGAGLAAWISLFSWAVLPPTCNSILERPGLAGVTSHPNTLGAVTALGLTLSWGASPRSGRELVVLWFLRVGLAVALLLSGSLTSLFFACVSGGLTWLLASRAYVRGVGVLLVAAGAIAFALTLAGLGVVGLLEAVGRDASLSGRDQLWAAVWQAGKAQPAFGSGFGAFWVEGRGREIMGTWNPRQAHNAYLDLFVDVGAVGGAFVLSLIGVILLEGWQRWRGEPASPERWATASFLSAAACLLLVYAVGESFLLKPDKFTFFSLLWVLAVLDRRPAPGSPS